MFGCDLIGKDCTCATGVHIAAPYPVKIEAGSIARLLQHRERIIGDVAADAKVFCRSLQVHFGGRCLQLCRLTFIQRLHIVEEARDLRRVAVVRDQRAEHLNVPPRWAVD